MMMIYISVLRWRDIYKKKKRDQIYYEIKVSPSCVYLMWVLLFFFLLFSKQHILLHCILKSNSVKRLEPLEAMFDESNIKE